MYDPKLVIYILKYLPAIECVVLLFHVQFSLLNLYDLPGQILRFPTTKSFESKRGISLKKIY